MRILCRSFRFPLCIQQRSAVQGAYCSRSSACRYQCSCKPFLGLCSRWQFLSFIRSWLWSCFVIPCLTRQNSLKRELIHALVDALIKESVKHMAVVLNLTPDGLLLSFYTHVICQFICIGNLCWSEKTCVWGSATWEQQLIWLRTLLLVRSPIFNEGYIRNRLRLHLHVHLVMLQIPVARICGCQHYRGFWFCHFKPVSETIGLSWCSWIRPLCRGSPL